MKSNCPFFRSSHKRRLLENGQSGLLFQKLVFNCLPNDNDDKYKIVCPQILPCIVDPVQIKRIFVVRTATKSVNEKKTLTKFVFIKTVIKQSRCLAVNTPVSKCTKLSNRRGQETQPMDNEFWMVCNHHRWSSINEHVWMSMGIGYLSIDHINSDREKNW